jgi:glycosyltransferase involved in cell wall biosynthesis
MRVLHVSDSFLPTLGGIENMVADLASRQVAEGHEVSVLTSAPAGPAGDGSDDGVHVIRVNGSAAQVLVDGSWDVVHCHASVLSPLARQFILRAKASGVPTAVTVHSLWSAAGPLLAVGGNVLRLRNQPVAWSAVSEVAAEPVRRALGPEAVVTVLPNAVDVGWWRRGVPGQGEPTAAVTVVSVLRMSTRKRPLPLLRMVTEARRLLPPGTDVRLVLAGDGPRTAAVRRHVDRHDLSSWVHLAGRLDRSEIRTLLAGSDLYIAPADYESFGIAALEARAVGLPVIAKRCGGVGDFVQSGTEGLLADSDQDMARCLADLVADGGLRRQMTVHNRAHPPVHDWPDALARTQALYARAELLAGAATAPRRASQRASSSTPEVAQ